MSTAVKPSLTLEPVYSYQEVADALGVSLSLIQKEAAAGRLPHRRQGRRMVCSQADITAWQSSLYERETDRRVGRMARRDQKPAPARKAGKPNGYSPNADADILSALKLPTK